MQTSTFRDGTRLGREVRLRYGWFRAYRDRGEKYWYISTFFVERAWRGKGYGRRLAKHLPQRCMLSAEPFDISSGGLDVAALRSFYESLGFKPAGGTLMSRESAPEKVRSRKRSKKPL